MDAYKYNCYKLCDDDIVSYRIVRDIILDTNNIKEHFQKHYTNNDDYDDDAYEYKHMLFNNYRDNYTQFEKTIKECDLHYDYIMYRIIIPAVLEYADEFDMVNQVVDWIKDHNDSKIVDLYSLSIAEDIIDEYSDYIKDIVNNTTAKKIAINKLKRNKIVNEGILLNLSMRDCGMFIHF